MLLSRVGSVVLEKGRSCEVGDVVWSSLHTSSKQALVSCLPSRVRAYVTHVCHDVKHAA
jgi:hypothetical protein